MGSSQGIITRLRWAASVVASRAFDSSLKGVILAPFADVPWPTGGFSGWADWPWPWGWQNFGELSHLINNQNWRLLDGLGKKIWYFLLGGPIAAHWIGMNGAFLSSHRFHLQVWDRGQGGPDSLRYVFVSTCWEKKMKKTLYSIHCLIILIIPQGTYIKTVGVIAHFHIPRPWTILECRTRGWEIVPGPIGNGSCQLPGGSIAQGLNVYVKTS